MPVENLEHEGLAKNPNLELAQLKFYLSHENYKNDTATKQKLLDAIKENGNSLCSLLLRNVIFTLFQNRHGPIL